MKMIQTIDRVEADTGRYIDSIFEASDKIRIDSQPVSHGLSNLYVATQLAEMNNERPYELLHKLCAAQELAEEHGFKLSAYHTWLDHATKHKL